MTLRSTERARGYVHVRTPTIGNFEIGDLADVSDGGILDGQGLVWDAATEQYIPGDVGVPDPETLTFTYNPDNTVSNILGATVDIDFTYNGDKTVNTVDDQVFIKTFSYNPNKTVDEITVTSS